MANKITFTTAVPEDAHEIMSVRRTAWLTTYPNEQEGITKEDIEQAINKRTNEEEVSRIKERILNDEGSFTWVAKDNGVVVGFISIRNDTARNWIASFYVLSDYQGLGIGTELMKQAFTVLDKNKETYCEVASYNQKAIAFYKKFGFVENGSTTNEVAKLPSGKVLPEIEMVRPAAVL